MFRHRREPLSEGRGGSLHPVAVLKLELFLDESGQFSETSTEPREKLSADLSRRRFPSQLAGVCAPAGELKRDAEQVLRQILGGQLPAIAHAVDLKQKDPGRYQAAFPKLEAALEVRGWRAVRLANLEGVSWGDRVANQTNAVAELVVRLLDHHRRKGAERVELRVICGNVRIGTVDEELDIPELMKEEDFQRRVREHLGFTAIRRGLAEEAAGWSVRVQLRSVKDRGLQLADFLSHGSHDDFSPLQPRAEEALRRAFGETDWSLEVRPLVEQADEALADGAVARALQLLTPMLVAESTTEGFRRAAQRRIEPALARLAQMGGPARAVQLQQLEHWLDTIIETQRDLVVGERVATWLSRTLVEGLQGRVEGPSLPAFELALCRWRLTAANHDGRLEDARGHVHRVEALLPSVLARQEHLELVSEALVAKAVHHTDCLEHDVASTAMSNLQAHHEGLAAFAADLVEGVVQHSAQRAKALGTQLQAEMYAGLRDPSRFEKARALSEQALSEFGEPTQIQRQCQYRAQLETWAGNLDEAGAWLARGIGLEPTATREMILDHIEGLPGFPRGFALLHFLRLTRVARDPLGLRCAGDSWVTEAGLGYPAHGIRRQLAALQAETGDPAAAERTLTALLKLPSTTVLELVGLAAWLEVAAHHPRADLLLGRRPKKKKGFLQAARRYRGDLPSFATRIDEVLAAWIEAVESEADGLSEMASQIGY